MGRGRTNENNRIKLLQSGGLYGKTCVCILFLINNVQSTSFGVYCQNKRSDRQIAHESFAIRHQVAKVDPCKHRTFLLKLV